MNLGQAVYDKMQELGCDDETMLVLLVAEETNTCSADVREAWELWQDDNGFEY